MRTGAIHSMKLGDGATGEIENSFATDQRGGVYIATNRKLYRFTAGRNGAPKITWQVTYPNSGEHKIGQVDDGTGTTPAGNAWRTRRRSPTTPTRWTSSCTGRASV